jgi:hypothetical protein
MKRRSQVFIDSFKEICVVSFSEGLRLSISIILTFAFSSNQVYVFHERSQQPRLIFQILHNRSHEYFSRNANNTLSDGSPLAVPA